MTDSETSGENRSPNAASNPWRALSLCVAALATLVGATAWLLPEVDGADLWWHMAAGRWVMTHGAVPLQDMFTFTEFGQDWADHEWLWGVLAWLSYEVHPDLVAWLNLAVAASVFALVGLRAFESSRSWAAAWGVTVFAAAASHWYIDVRPHLFTLLFTALLLWTFRFRWAPFSWPPILMLWVNLHGGFIFGVGLIGLHALVHSLKLRAKGEAAALRDWVGVALALLAVGLNPWGFAMYLEPFEHLRGDTPFSELLEWVPLVFSLDPRTYAGRFVWLFALALVGFWRGRRDPNALILVLLTALMTTQARRFVPLFAVVAAPVAAMGIAPVFEQLERRVRWPVWVPAMAATSLLVLSIFLWSGVRFLPQPLARWTLLESAPTGAVAYLAGMENPPRRVFNTYHWGGFITYFAPTVSIFIDGRATTLYSDETVGDYALLRSASPGFRALLAKYEIDAVLVQRPSPLASMLAGEFPPWIRIGVDPRSILMLAPHFRDLPPVQETLGDSADLQLARAFGHRMRRHYDEADAAVIEALERNPLQLYAHGEAMMVAAARKDPAGVQHWIDLAREVYPRRADLIATFADRAWRELGDYERSALALESLKLGGPFVTPETLADVASRIEISRAQARGDRVGNLTPPDPPGIER